MMKKLLSATISVFMILLLIVPALSVGAASSPYSKGYDDKESLLTAVKDYSGSFPKMEGYDNADLSIVPEGRHLENRDVILPVINDESYEVAYYSLAESSYGRGVDYTFTFYENEKLDETIRIIAYYSFNKEQIDKSLNNVGAGVEKGKIGRYNCVSYDVFSDDIAYIHTVCKIAVGDCLVEVYSYKDHKALAEIMEFEDTGVKLPVYVDNYENTLPEVAQGYNRYFFYMPDGWNTEYSESAGIYWNTPESSSDEFPGTPAIKTDVFGVYYYDVPESVDSIVWTNLVDGGDDRTQEIYHMELRAPGEPYGSDESFRLQDCDGKIFVLDYACVYYDEVIVHMVFGGDWYYYYGKGEYGEAPVRGDSEIYTDDAFHAYEISPPLPVYGKLGDADGNGKVDIKDATAIQKALAGIRVVCYGDRADVDDSGEMNIKDATAIQKYLASIETGYPIGELIEC